MLEIFGWRIRNSSWSALRKFEKKTTDKSFNDQDCTHDLKHRRGQSVAQLQYHINATYTLKEDKITSTTKVPFYEAVSKW